MNRPKRRSTDDGPMTGMTVMTAMTAMSAMSDMTGMTADERGRS